jgi:hypothetical protein
MQTILWLFRVFKKLVLIILNLPYTDDEVIMNDSDEVILLNIKFMISYMG